MFKLLVRTYNVRYSSTEPPNIKVTVIEFETVHEAEKAYNALRDVPLPAYINETVTKLF